ncbi:PHD finger protein enhancer of yellow 3 isoform X2 [Ptiloglossa arizonensis]|uniref:PHD finger protein enhancer of yellow 3 isoform X2 n=1 Tax=Ptiloglossa arizonensis TaxID=3350558 RepID=UPI003FA075BD
MSESPKMGLFGSKDETNETKKEAKDDSPDRYAPYCIDSDSETYDTEALSIMDINDIIGVQSEPVSDSTLESEIAALSQIITESKTDGSQNLTDDKFEEEEKDVTKDRVTCKIENINATQISDTNECLKSTLEELENVCATEATCVSDVDQLSEENSQLSNENTSSENLKLNNQQKNNDTNDNRETSVLTDSIAVIDVKDNENVSVTNKTDIVFDQSSGDCTLVTSEVAKEEESVNISDGTQQNNNVEISIVNNEVTTVKNENGIRGSLQLIGEAYSSEDSQEMNINDIEPNIAESSVSNESCSILNEEKKESNNSCKLPDNVNTVTEMPDIVDSSKACINKDILVETAENEVHNMEVDTSNSSIECKHAEEVPSILEEANIVHNECLNSYKNNVLESKKEETDVDLAETDDIKIEVLQQEKDNVEQVDENETMECSVMEVNEKTGESIDHMCISRDEKDKTEVVEENIEMEKNETEIMEEITEMEQHKEIIEQNIEMEKHETEIVEENMEMETHESLEKNIEVEKHEESLEYINTEEEKRHDNKECIYEEKITSQENEEHMNNLNAENNVDDTDTLLNTKLNDKVDTSNDIELTQKENELETESAQCQPENIDDSDKVSECQHSDSQHTKDNLEVSESKIDVLELPQEIEGTDSEKLENIVEMQEDFVKPSTSASSPKTNDPVTSEENSASDSQIIEELSIQTENLLNNTENVCENLEINKDIQIEDSESQNPVLSETEDSESQNLVPSEIEDSANKNPIPSETEDNESQNPVPSKTETKEAADELVEAMELSEEKLKDELEISTSVIPDITFKCETPMEIELNLDSAAPVIDTVAVSNITIPTNTCITEDNFERKIDSLEENSNRTEAEMEIISTESLKIDECISGEQIQDTMIEKTEIEETSNAVDIIEQHTELKDTEIPGTQEDVHLNLSEEKQSDRQLDIEKQESFHSEILVQQEQSTETETSELKEHEDISRIDEEEDPEQSVENDTKTLIQSEVVVKVEETKDSVNNEDQILALKSVMKDAFLPPDCTEVLVTEEDAEEEDTEEELNLTLEPEETELQPEMDQNNSEQTLEEENMLENIEETSKEDEPSVPDIEMDDINADSLNIEKLDIPDINIEETMNLNNTEDSMITEDINKNQELSSKQQLEDSDSKSDVDGNNLNILETSNNVEDMFTGEQSQNTEDIVTSILDDVGSATDFKNILTTEAVVVNEIENVLQQSTDLPLVETEMEELTEKLPQDSEDILNKDMEDTISTQNMDSLEGLLGLDLMPESEDPALKTVESGEQTQEEVASPKDVDMSLLLEQSNDAPDVTQTSDYITDVISSCLTDSNTLSLEDNTEKTDTTETIDDKAEEPEASNVLKVNDILISESMSKHDNVEDLQKELDTDTGLPENELDMDFEETPLESVDDLEETESKLELASDILLSNVEQSENLNDTSTCVETSQPSSEISELESAVKFLQESEEQAIDSPLVLSPKLVESVVDDITKQADASLFVPDEDMCEDTSELVVELENIATDSISISEAEIISEAAKLESERKLAEQVKIDTSVEKFETKEDEVATNEEEKIEIPETEVKQDTTCSLQNLEVQQPPNFDNEKVTEVVLTLPQKILKVSEAIPKVSILEERLKEPPKIEIPSTDVTKVAISPTTSKDCLLIPKDAKLVTYQKMLESPKLSEKSEPKITETPRKDSEKHDFENVGSPRIILKIAKSAITDCGEPRSPKSPKIRSATNSPNPEDSPGQKLGKIKLKLSKSGHPSIISNENVDEVGQWYSEGSMSLSPIGMKIKLSKSGDGSIVTSEKHETDDSKETKHKFEEAKRTESPIGMKIKLSKTGDASIVQQDAKDKHKEKLDIVQGSPKRTESPIGMKIKLSKSGDASIIQLERQDPSEEHRETQLRPKEKLETSYDSPKRTDSPIGMKIKLSKTGDATIVSPDVPDESKETTKAKDKVDNSSPEIPKRTESPIGMKIKLARTKGGASIISMENTEDTKEKLEIPDAPKRTESPLGMKIKLSKSGDASIVHSEILDEVKDTKQKEKLEIKEKLDVQQDTMKVSDTPSVMKIKVIKSGETSMVAQESVKDTETAQEAPQKIESPIGMKIKLSKFGDPSIVPTEKQEQPEESRLHQETPKRTESPIGMKIKLSKTGDASIIQSEVSEDTNKTTRADAEHSTKLSDATLGMKIKLLKTGDASIVDTEKKERQQKRRDTESPLEMKIKLSKTGHPTIVACDSHGEPAYRAKEVSDQSHSFVQRYKEPAQSIHKEPALKILKTGHSTILQSNRSELTIEPVQMSGKKPDSVIDISPKRKEITIAPIESKKSKLETQLTQILPEVTIQPVTSRDQKQFLFDPKTSAISLQQMNVISQEISITQVRPSKPSDTSMSEKLKDILAKNTTGSPMNSDCEIIEHRPELIIVNENSNSSQDVVIIEEVSPARIPEVKVPKKRGRPRRNPLAQAAMRPPPHMLMPRDPLSLDEAHQMQQPQVPHFESRENERPKRTCRSQKSYAPPRRGRGRGRGKRKLDTVDLQMIKKPRLEQDLNAIEASTTAVITIDGPLMQQQSFGKSPELYKVLKQPAMDAKVNTTVRVEKKTVGQKNDVPKSSNVANSTLPDSTTMQVEVTKISEVRLESSKTMPKPMTNDSKDSIKDKKLTEVIPEKIQKTALKQSVEEKSDKTTEIAKPENKETLVPPEHPNWLTPTSKRPADGAGKHENVSTVQVIDEETRMSAESGSRSQTPARNISAPASETIVNEESQGSVLSTATTESEKVKVKNRRMEINFDPDEGPFTVDKIAEYEWPLDRKGETFMIQEQISQYLGVKSFKRKYPDLKRRVVDMEERNYLRENGLVSEAMCDMGLTAICSSEVLDVMCSDFPDQYEEYRKHMREKQVKEHSKKQKELTAAANAEKNRIDLAEMAVQSALSWNISLNKARRENRKCSLDLQTFTIHVPKKQQKVETERKVGHYPVALIPGQYTDYYREYTPAELRYYPLNTVLYGPMRPNERKFDSQSEGSQSDSDSDSSSDDSSEGTQDTEGSQSTMDEVDMEIVNQKDEVKLKCKMCLKTLNKHSKNEILIQCGTCNGHVHPSCIDLTLDMVPHIQSYAWQCTDCKTCAQCHDPADEDKMLFCDMCDRGYHIYCVGLRRVPQGRWHCQECAVCANCSSREPGGVNSDRNSVAQWQHEYKKGDKNTRVYVSTLCVPCSKLWRKGRYCPHCSRCHTAPRLDLEANLVHCSACDKYLHLGCVETKGMPLDRKNYLCDFCAPNRQQVVKPLVSKTLKT